MSLSDIGKTAGEIRDTAHESLGGENDPKKHKFPDNHVCFYQEEQYEGAIDSYPGKENERTLLKIPVARSVRNNTNYTVFLYDTRSGHADSQEISPNASSERFRTPALSFMITSR
jgi:hypothetical protein